jgi:hypothetical protein
MVARVGASSRSISDRMQRTSAVTRPPRPARGRTFVPRTRAGRSGIGATRPPRWVEANDRYPPRADLAIRVLENTRRDPAQAVGVLEMRQPRKSTRSSPEPSGDSDPQVVRVRSLFFARGSAAHSISPQRRPIRHGHLGAIALQLFGGIGFNLVARVFVAPLRQGGLAAERPQVGWREGSAGRETLGCRALRCGARRGSALAGHGRGAAGGP